MRGNLRSAAIPPASALSRACAAYAAHFLLALFSTGKKQMAAKDFFDTNILIYAVAKNDHRASKAEALLESGGLISVQSLNEFCSVARRKLGMSWKAIREFLELICILCPDPVS